MGWIGARCISSPSQPFCCAADVSMGAGVLSTRHIPICPSGNDPWVAWLARLARCTSWSCRCLLFFPAAAASLWAWLGSGWCSCSACMGRPGPLDLCEACVSVGPLHASQGFVWPPSASNHTRARSRLERQASAPPRFAARADETSADAMPCFLLLLAHSWPAARCPPHDNKRFLASSRRGRAQPVPPSIGPRATSERDGAIAAHSAIALARLRRPAADAAHCTPAAATHSRKGRILPTTPPLLAAGAIFENFPALACQTLPELAQTSLLATLTALR